MINNEPQTIILCKTLCVSFYYEGYDYMFSKQINNQGKRSETLLTITTETFPSVPSKQSETRSICWLLFVKPLPNIF